MMRGIVFRRTVTVAVALTLLAACRGNRPASASDVVVQFYTMKEAAGIDGAPDATQLNALSPFITDSLREGLRRADSVRTADKRRAPDEKPSYVEGDLFSSTFEGPTAFVVTRVTDAASPARIIVNFSDDRAKPAVHWTDTVIVQQQNGKWLVHDIRYGGGFAFGNAGALLMQLPR